MRDPAEFAVAEAESSPYLSVVIPVFNEEQSLEELVSRTLATCDKLSCPYELILIDDGSTDSSPFMIEALSMRPPGAVLGVLLNRNYGQHAAVLAGFEHSRGDLVITLDADLQNPPEEIATVFEKAGAGFDVVGSVRTPRNDSLFRQVFSAIVNRVVRHATGVDMRDYGCMLRAYRRPIVDAILACPEHSTFIPAIANCFARNTAEVAVAHAPRVSGSSKYDLMKLINLQFDLLTSVTTAPLRLLTVLGALIAMLAAGFGGLLLVLRILYGSEWASDGVFTLFSVLFFFVGAQFVGMGLLGEYLGRTYETIRARPRYSTARVCKATSERLSEGSCG